MTNFPSNGFFDFVTYIMSNTFLLMKVNLKTSVGGPALSLGCRPRAPSAGDTIQWGLLGVAPGPAPKRKALQTHVGSPPVGSASFWIAPSSPVGEKRPHVRIKVQRTAARRVPSSRRLAQALGSMAVWGQCCDQRGSSSSRFYGGWAPRVPPALRVLPGFQVSCPS